MTSHRFPSRGASPMRRATLLAALLLMAALATACGGANSGTPTPGDEPAGETYSGLLGASEFVVGENRFPFGLASVNGDLLEEAVVEVSFYSMEGDAEPELRTTGSATWRSIEGESAEHDHGHAEEGDLHLHIRGAYVVEGVEFDRPGFWMAEFEVTGGPDGQPRTEGAAFEVKESSTAPGIGEPVPATENLTIHDVESFSDISTRPVEDDMHNVSVAQALELGEPFVVLFASPQFCVSAICGPVTDEVGRVHDQFKERMEFIHIEPWDLDAARNEGRLAQGPEMIEWRLPSEPWTFVVDGDGHVAARFEGLVTDDDLVPAVEAVLGQG